MTRAVNVLRWFLSTPALLVMSPALALHAQGRLPYTTYTSFSQVLEGKGARYLTVTRVSNPGTREHPAYTGFYFYQCLQFDARARYLLGMRVYFQQRPVQPADRGDVGLN